MNTNLMQILRSRGFAFAVHVILWVLVYLVLSNSRNPRPAWIDERSYSLPAQDLAPVSRMGPLFSPAGLLSRAPQSTNDTSMFLTRYFVPATKPAVPPPTSVKIPMTYLGFYETASGSRQVILKAPDGFAVVRMGGSVLTNFSVAEATMQMLLLTNTLSQTNLLLLNTETALEIPLK